MAPRAALDNERAKCHLPPHRSLMRSHARFVFCVKVGPTSLADVGWRRRDDGSAAAGWNFDAAQRLTASIAPSSNARLK
jgi:hypothetical protein